MDRDLVLKGGMNLDYRMQNRTCDRCELKDRYRERKPSEDLMGENAVMQECTSESEDFDWREGVLPPVAPLANPYVPFQRNNPPTYEPRNGVVRGTLFPGLDLPYKGMINKEPLSRSGMHDLQTLAFAITELGEYLDTHSGDKEAFELFRNYVRIYKENKACYEATHGPLMQCGTAEQDAYNWLKDPWPWDFEANKEG